MLVTTSHAQASLPELIKDSLISNLPKITIWFGLARFGLAPPNWFPPSLHVLPPPKSARIDERAETQIFLALQRSAGQASAMPALMKEELADRVGKCLFF